MTSDRREISRAAEFWSKFVQPHVPYPRRIPYCGRPDVAEKARQKIDDELAAMHLAICSLRTYRNALAPLSSLPPEILTRILQFHAIDQPPSRWNRRADLGWIRVTHVCRFWRDAALHHPAIWSDVTTELGPRWLGLMLDRAKSLPLSYRQVECRENSERFLKQIIPRLQSQIHSLSASDTSEVVNVVIQFLKSPAEMLHALKLSATMCSRQHRTVLPARIFNNNSPMLRRLHLRNVWVPWSASILRGLTHLHLERSEDLSRISSLENDFLCALEGMPSLETLYLANVIPAIGPDAQSADGRIIRLPCLRNLTFIDDGPRCLDIVEQLDIPSSCRLHFRCGYYDEMEIHDLLPVLCDEFSRETDPFHTLSIIVVDDYVIGLELWRESSVHDPNTHYPSCDPDLLIGAFSLDDRGDVYIPLREIAKFICDALPLNNVHTIIVRREVLITTGCDWKRLFASNCRKVKNIFVGHEKDFGNLCKALATALDGEVEGEEGDEIVSTQERLLFPDLQVLTLLYVNLTRYLGWDGNGIQKGNPLLHALDMRRTRGRGISAVRLEKDCVIDTARLNALRDVVHVECDPGVIQDIPKAPLR